MEWSNFVKQIQSVLDKSKTRFHIFVFTTISGARNFLKDHKSLKNSMCCGIQIIQMPNICFLNFSTKRQYDFHKIFFFNLSRNYSFVQIMILHCLFFHNCHQEQQRMHPHSNPRHQRKLFLTDFDAQGLSASLDAYFDPNRRNFQN